jgi:hypothetical protein
MKTAGLFNPAWDVIYQLDPEWLEQFLGMAADLYRSVLPPKLVELMAIAVDASCTHLYTPGIRRTVQGALAQGPPSKRSWKFSSYAGHLGSTRASSAPRSCPREWRRLTKGLHQPTSAPPPASTERSAYRCSTTTNHRYAHHVDGGIGDSAVQLFPCRDCPISRVQLGFRVTSIDEVAAALDGLDISHQLPGPKRLVTVDPDGNRVHVILHVVPDNQKRYNMFRTTSVKFPVRSSTLQLLSACPPGVSPLPR